MEGLDAVHARSHRGGRIADRGLHPRRGLDEGRLPGGRGGHELLLSAQPERLGHGVFPRS